MPTEELLWRACTTDDGGTPTGWLPGDAFPAGASRCGGWSLTGYALPLVDPNPDPACGSGADALPWWVATTSTCTVRLADGTWRMYMQSPSLAAFDRAGDQRWPYDDADGNPKFPSVRSEGLDWWWRAGAPLDTSAAWSVSDLRFSPDYIAYVDSADGGATFPVYAPRLEVADSSTSPCTWDEDDPDFDAAGWRSTFLPCRDDTTVYRDATVLYLPGPEKYVMFAIQCRSKTGVKEGEDPECSICAPPPAGSACDDGSGVPDTRIVAVVCADADFQADDSEGPYEVVLPASGFWIGVPQAFVDPSEGWVFLYVPESGGANNGLWAASMSDLESAVDRLGSDSAALAGAFTHLGDVTIEHPDAPAPTLTDPHFVFCDGRLHLYFANRSSGDVDDPLNETAQAVALSAFDADGFAADPADAAAMRMVLDHVLNGCEPLSWWWFLRNGCTLDGDGALVFAEGNDPDVAQTSSGTFRMNVHCAALGGLVYATADEADLAVGCADLCALRYPSGGGVWQALNRFLCEWGCAWSALLARVLEALSNRLKGGA